MKARSVAVVGSGVAGLTAAHVLRSACDVTLYEAEPRLGGHAHTHERVTADGRPLSVDSERQILGAFAYSRNPTPIASPPF
jgi:predicted NAD/FAD-binding protein